MKLSTSIFVGDLFYSYCLKMLCVCVRAPKRCIRLSGSPRPCQSTVCHCSISREFLWQKNYSFRQLWNGQTDNKFTYVMHVNSMLKLCAFDMIGILSVSRTDGLNKRARNSSRFRKCIQQHQHEQQQQQQKKTGKPIKHYEWKNHWLNPLITIGTLNDMAFYTVC